MHAQKRPEICGNSGGRRDRSHPHPHASGKSLRSNGIISSRTLRPRRQSSPPSEGARQVDLNSLTESMKSRSARQLEVADEAELLIDRDICFRLVAHRRGNFIDLCPVTGPTSGAAGKHGRSQAVAGPALRPLSELKAAGAGGMRACKTHPARYAFGPPLLLDVLRHAPHGRFHRVQVYPTYRMGSKTTLTVRRQSDGINLLSCPSERVFQPLETHFLRRCAQWFRSTDRFQ